MSRALWPLPQLFHVKHLSFHACAPSYVYVCVCNLVSTPVSSRLCRRVGIRKCTQCSAREQATERGLWPLPQLFHVKQFSVLHRGGQPHRHDGDSGHLSALRMRMRIRAFKPVLTSTFAFQHIHIPTRRYIDNPLGSCVSTSCAYLSACESDSVCLQGVYTGALTDQRANQLQELQDERAGGSPSARGSGRYTAASSLRARSAA